jgi:hypothetical protein
MLGKIDFRYDAAEDIVFATPHWHIETIQDVLAWYQQYVRYFESTFAGRKVDLVLDLADFRISPSIAREWGEYRARLNSTHTRFSWRVSADPRVRLHVLTSGARHGAGKQTDEAATLEDAVAAIKAARRAAGV